MGFATTSAGAPIRDQKVPAPLKPFYCSAKTERTRSYPGPKGPGPIEARGTIAARVQASIYPGPKGPGPIEAARVDDLYGGPVAIRDQKVPAPLKLGQDGGGSHAGFGYPGPKGPGPIEA